jgi:predicted NAD-dependent protein-ADP-ribosyltransferase YbiA (DUF1768 family)
LLHYDGDEYLCAAAAFEAAKIANRRDRVSFIGWNVLPWAVPRLARNIPKNWVRTDWSAVQHDIMLEIQRSKFSWPELRARLADIGDAELVYGNINHDNVWGVCMCQSVDPLKRIRGLNPLCTGHGSNHLGHILMRVAQECRLGFHCAPVAPTCGQPVLAAA